MESRVIVVDRIEEDEAVLEMGGRLVSVPRALLPEGAREGSVLRLAAAEPEAEAAVLDEAQRRLERLRARTPPSGDIEL